MCHILLVEDNSVFRSSLREMLAIRFPEIKICEASDGEEALEKFNSSCPALIFIDIRLPGKNGLEITKIIKEADSGVEVAILTSHDNPEYRAAALSSGASRFFAKGNAGGDEIADFVKSALQRRGKEPGR